MKFIPRIASKLGISRKTDRLNIEILREAKNRRALIGKTPVEWLLQPFIWLVSRGKRI